MSNAAARNCLNELVGREIHTITGRPNAVIALEDDVVIVGTSRSPNGRPVPIRWVQDAMDVLDRDGEVTIDVKTVGYRSAFVGAVLSTLPGVVVLPTSPPRIARRGGPKDEHARGLAGR